jgi:8-oxo-dGTP pyrophosphatase MutT (NUDIX family)
MRKLQEGYWFYIDHICESPMKFVTFIHIFVPLLKWKHSEVRPLLNEFWHINARIPRAGGILLNRDKTKLVLVRAPHSKRWSFPVGKISTDYNEDIRKSAEREVFEETGYCATLSADAKMFRYTKRKAQHSLFIFENVPEHYPFAPMSTKEIAEISWFSFSELDRILPQTVLSNLVTFLRE